jgi:hypothetical protein
MVMVDDGAREYAMTSMIGKLKKKKKEEEQQTKGSGQAQSLGR